MGQEHQANQEIDVKVREVSRSPSKVNQAFRGWQVDEIVEENTIDLKAADRKRAHLGLPVEEEDQHRLALHQILQIEVTHAPDHAHQAYSLVERG